MQPPERASSAYSARNMRSSITMMKYLSRTSSDGELNKVVQQQARVEGTVADRRRRAGKLRNEQEELELQMTSQMQSLATTMQADAHARAAVKARQAAAVRQMNVAAEQAARTMGAVAPHRAAARDAALAVVAPKESWSGGGGGGVVGGGASDATAAAPTDVNAHYSVLLAEHSACMPVRSGKYSLRAVAHSAAGRADASFLTYSPGGGLACCGAEAAGAAPWTVRQPAGGKSVTFATAGGAKLYATAGGALAVGEPPRADLAHFVVLAQPGGGGPEMPSPRPFSSCLLYTSPSPRDS